MGGASFDGRVPVRCGIGPSVAEKFSSVIGVAWAVSFGEHVSPREVGAGGEELGIEPLTERGGLGEVGIGFVVAAEDGGETAEVVAGAGTTGRCGLASFAVAGDAPKLATVRQVCPISLVSMQDEEPFRWLDQGAEMSDRFARFAPLITGVLFVAFAVDGTQMTANTPSSTANGATVLAYYKAHNARMGGAGFSLMLSVVAGLFFYGILRSYLSRSPRAEWVANIGFGGAIVFGVGALVGAGVSFAFSDVGTDLSAPTAQVLNILQGDLGAFLFATGLCALMLGFGIAILRGRLMPGWLGWITIVIGVLAAAGPGIGIAIPLEAVWVLVMSVMLFQRNAVVSPRADAPAPLGTANA